MFERAEMSPEEQWEEPCCIQEIELTNPKGKTVKRSLEFTYRFDPDQECKFRSFKRETPKPARRKSMRSTGSRTTCWQIAEWPMKTVA